MKNGSDKTWSQLNLRQIDFFLQRTRLNLPAILDKKITVYHH